MGAFKINTESNYRISYKIERMEGYSKIRFKAMASPCEVLVRTKKQKLCRLIADTLTQETARVESKYSRYIKNNLLWCMNHSSGKKIAIDSETFALLEYARNLFELSDGFFDITSGVLRRIWSFTPNSKPPAISQVEAILPFIGFSKTHYDSRHFAMPEMMEVDFGGIGKEYAVDQSFKLARRLCDDSKTSFLINYGGDLSAKTYSKTEPDWIVGVENDNANTPTVIRIKNGSVATSGNDKRFFDHNTIRYSHLMNAKTGYPVLDAPSSITAFSTSCVLAGSFSSLAMMRGENAEAFLQSQDIKFICIR